MRRALSCGQLFVLVNGYPTCAPFSESRMLLDPSPTMMKPPVEWHGLIGKLLYQIQLCTSKRGAFVLAGRDLAIEVLHQVERVNVARSPKARNH
jgi:hypothetical protein